MDHEEAKRSGAVERYLLDELPARERGAFEEHFFGCPECAADVRMTAEFLQVARHELKRDMPGGDLPGRPGPPLAGRIRWYPGVGAAAAAVLLCVVAYQNFFVYPQLNAQIARLNNPGILSSVYLVGGITRGPAAPQVTASKARPMLLSVDIPTGDQYATYACVLLTSYGTIVWRLPVEAEQAKDTVPIVVPAGSLPAGHYTLIVQGYTKRAGQAPEDLAHYPFTVSSAMTLTQK